MRQALYRAAVLVAALFTPVASADEAKSDLKSLEGTWEVVSIEVSRLFVLTRCMLARVPSQSLLDKRCVFYW